MTIQCFFLSDQNAGSANRRLPHDVEKIRDKPNKTPRRSLSSVSFRFSQVLPDSFRFSLAQPH